MQHPEYTTVKYWKLITLQMLSCFVTFPENYLEMFWTGFLTKYSGSC